MLQEERLDRGEDTTGSSLVLVDAILQLLVKEEPLLPRVVEVTFSILEEQLGDLSALLQRDIAFNCLLDNHLSHLRIDCQRVGPILVEVRS